MYLISGNVTSNLLLITGNGNIRNITSNFRTLIVASAQQCILSICKCSQRHIFDKWHCLLNCLPARTVT